jgi:aspartate/methionine/tyrosine aminotransferase
MQVQYHIRHDTIHATRTHRPPQSTDSVAFRKRLLVDTGVALAPGKAFGAGGEGWLRLCFENESDHLHRAFDALEQWLDTQCP